VAGALIGDFLARFWIANLQRAPKGVPVRIND
jgi:hypothetical protein